MAQTWRPAAASVCPPEGAVESVAWGVPSAVPLCPVRGEPEQAGFSGALAAPCGPLAKHTMKCSLRVWFLSVAFLLVFILSLLFTYSHHSMAALPYLDSGALGGTHRVKLLPGYAGLQRLSKEGPAGKGCACLRCLGDSGASDWFDSRFDGSLSPVWTQENMDLPPDVQRWWMVREQGLAGGLPLHSLSQRLSF